MNTARFPFRRLLGFAVVSAALAGGASANDLAWQSLSLPASGVAGTTVNGIASLSNTGEECWGADHFLAVRNASMVHAAPPPSLDGIEPGGDTTVYFALTLPAAAGVYTYYFQGLEHNVEYFGEVQTRTITVTPAPAPPRVLLAATSFSAAAPPTISTADSVIQAPYYRLRAKVINGSSTGWHAANLWGNNNRPLDSPPPAGNYGVCALYWVRYDAIEGSVAAIGPETTTPISVRGSVQLSTYSFNGASRARVFTDEAMGGTPFYRLFATFSNPQIGTFETAGGLNNNNAVLTGLPPSGTYTVSLYWRRYDLWGNLVETGPVRSTQVTFTAGPLLVLNAGGYISATNWENPDDGTSGTNYSSEAFEFSVPVAGSLRIFTSGLYRTWGDVFDSNWNTCAFGDHDITVNVQPGSHVITVAAESEGSYLVFGELTPASPPPVVTSAASAMGTFGSPFTYQITATNGPTSYGASPLPLGLTVQASTGVIAGTPTQAGTYPVWVTAANGAGSGGQTVTITIASSGGASGGVSGGGLVVGSAPAISVHPQSQTGALGSTIAFSVSATGTAPLSYQWRKGGAALANGSTVSGATTANLTVTLATASDAGNYNVIVSNSAGSATSNLAVVTVATGDDGTPQLKVHRPL